METPNRTPLGKPRYEHSVFFREHPKEMQGYDPLRRNPSQDIMKWIADTLAEACDTLQKFALPDEFRAEVALIRDLRHSFITLNRQCVLSDGRMLWFIVGNQCKHDAKELEERIFQYQVDVQLRLT